MLYVQQSLSPNEEIIRVGEFHWMYTFNAVLWIVVGFAFMVGILYGGYYWEISRAVSSQFQGLPEQLQSQAWDEVVRQRGGMFSVIGGLHIGIKLAAFAMLGFGLLSFAGMMVRKATTEICVTSDRLIIKTGVVARQVNEINVDRIEGVNVMQGIIGRIANFGTVVVRGMGVGEVWLPPIEDPVGFRRSIDRAKALDHNEKSVDI